jgi:hypothetical protein
VSRTTATLQRQLHADVRGTETKALVEAVGILAGRSASVASRTFIGASG